MAYSVALQIAQSINIAVTVLFLALFSHRFYYLSSFSMTDRYRNYYPKLRIFFSMIYVALSIGLLILNLAAGSYPDKYWYEYIFQGGGGEILDSLILLIQLGVLRFELNKQQPYTPYHLLYFIYLTLISLVRFVFTLLDLGQFHQLNTIPNFIISILLVVDSTLQFGYWVAKKQSLPQFERPTSGYIEDIRNHSHLIVRPDFSERSYWHSQDEFPFLRPTVKIQHGRIRIILELPRKVEESDMISPRKGILLQEPLIILEQKSYRDWEIAGQVVSSGLYTTDEVKRLYIACGRFQMQKKLRFQEVGLQEMALDLQAFLEELLKEKRSYCGSVLRCLKVPLERARNYGQLIETKNSTHVAEEDIDETLGVRISHDRNAPFVSLQVYRHLWVSDHYQFYIKATLNDSSQPSYPVKRYSEFEDLHSALKQYSKGLARPLELPTLPKKHLFHWNEDAKTGARRQALQVYLRKVSNDYLVMGSVELRQRVLSFLQLETFGVQGHFLEGCFDGVKVVKGGISRALIENDLVTFYEFKLFRNGMEERVLNKRFSDFEELHHELQRWMHNVQITYRLITLPEKHIYKSEARRHEKMRIYLQNVLEIKEASRIYSVILFFNVQGSHSDDLSVSAAHTHSKHRKTSEKAVDGIIELRQSSPPHLSISERSSNRFNQMIDDLGNQEFD